MAKERLGLGLEPEVREIFRLIDNGENFLLSGGAGSGKTYSLVQAIKQVIAEEPTSRIACITYTNAAVKEIEERVAHQNLSVSTIHDFLWDNIKHFRTELKRSLVALINDDQMAGIKNPEDTPVPESYFDALENGIQYKEYLKLKDGIVSHDEVLILANYIFKTYPKLCDILKDKFKFILIDEYQDTNASVVEILLVHIKQSKKKNIIGFFGDAMQSIYDDGVGNLDLYKGDEAGKVKEVKKEQNRRNPRAVIELANKLRTDGIIQVPSTDINAPNMIDNIIKEGKIQFYYSDKDDLDLVRTKIGWNFENAKQTKILNLTHNLIAPKAGFSGLMEIYDRDPVIKLKNELSNKIKDNKKSKAPIEVSETDTFDQVVDKFQLKNRRKQLKKDILLADATTRELFNQLKDLPFSEVRKIYLDKESLIDDKKQDKTDESKKGSKRDDLIKYLFKIQSNISFYQAKQYNEFIRVTEYRIASIADKMKLQERIQELTDVGDKTIEEIINKADEFGICKKDDAFARFVSEKEYLYNRVKNVKYLEFQHLYNYLEGYTPFSTQHKVKGTEFDNVLVILDNGGWNNYNFQGLFEGNGPDSVRERTKKIFYVCCTRTKENLAVFFYNPSALTIVTAKGWFGEGNVCEI